MDHQEILNQWALLDKILGLIQELDTEDLTPNQVRLKIYHDVFDLKPLKES